MVKKAIVLLSGGIDSTTCLAIASSQNFECYTLCFDYGQKHNVELIAAQEISLLLGAKEHKIFKLSLNEFKGCALTDLALSVPDYQGTADIPITYVPARNTVFLSVALAYAEVINAYDIFIGVSSIDYSHYPDCRPEYIKQFTQLANLATKAGIEGNKFTIHAPLVHLNKAETILAGLKLSVDYRKTISCYRANAKGKACGNCDSCTLRKKGFLEAGISDMTEYQN